MYTAAQSEEHCRLMQNRIDQLVQWTKDWQIRFNSGKCNIYMLGKIMQSLNILWMAGSFYIATDYIDYKILKRFTV